MQETKRALHRSTASILVSGIALLMAVTVADSAPQCFRSAEIKADQAIRSDARLIMLSDTCSGRTYLFMVQRPQPTNDRRQSGPQRGTAPPALRAARNRRQ